MAVQGKPSNSPSDRLAEYHGVDSRAPTPLYHQIYLILRGKILDGTYARDDMLPGEQEISRRFGVSRITSKRALDELAAAGFAVRERGRGTRVNYAAPRRPLTSSVEGLLENLLAMGLETEVRVLELAYVPASEDVARALACDVDHVVQRAERVRLLKRQPLSHLTTYVPEDIARSYVRDDLAKTPLLTLLERCGVEVSSAEQTISADLADGQISALLKVDIGAPLLSIRRIVYDQNQRPVEYIKGLYRPDRYQYHMMLNRVQGKERNLWSPAA